MTLAMENAKVLTPRSNRLPVLVRHDSGHLMHVRQIVHCPRRQQLRQGDRAKRRVESSPVQVVLPQLQPAEVGKVGRTDTCKFVQQFTERPALNLPDVAHPVEWLEFPCLPASQDQPQTRPPRD